MSHVLLYALYPMLYALFTRNPHPANHPIKIFNPKFHISNPKSKGPQPDCFQLLERLDQAIAVI
jgi:hypothetical protein